MPDEHTPGFRRCGAARPDGTGGHCYRPTGSVPTPGR